MAAKIRTTDVNDENDATDGTADKDEVNEGNETGDRTLIEVMKMIALIMSLLMGRM